MDFEKIIIGIFGFLGGLVSKIIYDIYRKNNCISQKKEIHHLNFLEKIGILFSASVYIEGIIKDLIIFKKNPELIEEINKGIISDKLNKEREEIFKKSFDQDIVDEFVSLYNLHEKDKNLFTVILLLRDILGHSRISVEEQKIWFIPKYEAKTKKCKKYFGIEGEGSIFTIDNHSLYFEEKIKAIEIIDKKILPSYAKDIGLDYGRLR